MPDLTTPPGSKRRERHSEHRKDLKQTHAVRAMTSIPVPLPKPATTWPQREKLRLEDQLLDRGELRQVLTERHLEFRWE